MIKGITKIMAVALVFALMSGIALAQDKAGKTLVEGNNSFAFSLYRELSNDQGNLFFSPYSISAALAMTWLGARGKTADEMTKTMSFTLKAEELHPAFGRLISELNAAGGQGSYELVVANRLWGQKGYNFLKAFLKSEEEYYSSTLQEVDFKGSPEQARACINTWVEKTTEGKIKDLIPQGLLGAASRLVLTNAIYFKSNWENEFQKEMTRKEPFFLNKAKKINVDMMHKTERLDYAAAGDAELVEIPYRDFELSMGILLPKDKDGLKKLEKSINHKMLQQMRSKLKSFKVELSLPKFRTTSSFSLGEIFQKMGMKTPFQLGAADFSGMDGTKLLYISEIIHKAFVDVNEEGTEAAAATAVTMKAGGMPPQEEKIIKLKVDHPFIFYIRDNKSGSLLFMGRITDPGKK